MPCPRRPAGDRAAVLALLAALLAAPAVAQPMPAVTGYWLTLDRSTVLDVQPCGANLCGRIVGMVRDPGRPMPTDEHGVPECGMTIMRGFRRTAANLWQGDILDPDHGRDYTAEFWLGEGGLHLRGYVGLPLFGMTQVWTRYPYRPPADCRLASVPG